jgi:hypothetical protein
LLLVDEMSVETLRSPDFASQHTPQAEWTEPLRRRPLNYGKRSVQFVETAKR